MELTECKLRFDPKFVIWQSIYSILLIMWTVGLFLPGAVFEFGREPAQWILAFGVLPSILLVVLGVTRPLWAYKAAMGYAAILVLATIAVAVTAYGFLWVIVAFPFLGFIVEGVYIYWRWHAIREWASEL
ncbi:MAG: hypothetical protein ABFD54_01910 [Armatimonadota bacterium]|nr:hypothetical protein [bacterium]